VLADEALSLDEIERYGRVYGTGPERRALCPFCDHPKRDAAHATLAFNAETGAWTCHRCGRSGLLAEYWTKRDDPLPRRLRRARRGPRRRDAPCATPPQAPAEDGSRHAQAGTLWRASLPIDAPEAAPGAAYLAGRGIPPDVAARAGVRYHPRYPDAVHGVTHRHAALVFRVQGADGAGVAIECRYLEPRPDSAKGKSRGTKGGGVFVALPGALDADGVTVCEGPLTALSMAACGYPAVALCGQKAAPWLARRLALRDVFVAFDEGEQKTEAAAADFARALAAVGARPYRLRLPSGVDVNDRLQAVGLEALRRELDAAICGALVRPA